MSEPNNKCGRCVQDYCCPLDAVAKERDEWRAEAARLHELIRRQADDRAEAAFRLEDEL